jgi:hypothetical protein
VNLLFIIMQYFVITNRHHRCNFVSFNKIVLAYIAHQQQTSRCYIVELKDCALGDKSIKLREILVSNTLIKNGYGHTHVKKAVKLKLM